MASTNTWQPNWALLPGEVLAEELENRDMSQSELARRMGRPVKTINEIVNGKAAITPETALQLELALGISSGMWLGLETHYRSQIARAKAQDELSKHVAWAKQFPLADLRRAGLLGDATGPDLVGALLGFFGVSSVKAWNGHWVEHAAYRRAESFESNEYAVAAWLRWGERAALEMEVEGFDKTRLTAFVVNIRPLTREEPFSDVLEEVGEELAACGVALVLTPELNGTRLSGAARWLTSNKALVQVSMRYRSDDQFWFTLLHELFHLLDSRRSDHLDGDEIATDDAAESRVNEQARDLLIPPYEYERFVNATPDLTREAVRDFAKTLSVSPGILVGRLQRDRHLAPSTLNDLKRRIDWF
ncbi:MAG: HigA family addiction module antitoxin [Solirubrobacteraceae bacterium]|nr:HigA family addiction module antitoxin [Patulibacter sp.]